MGFSFSDINPFKVVKKINREIGRFYEKHIGRTGAIESGTDIMRRPEVIVEDLYKKSGFYYASKASPELTGAAIGYAVGGPTGAVVGYSAGAQVRQYQYLSDMSPPPIPPTSKLGPAPTIVMAGDRAAKGADRLKKRRRATVMGGDYGILNISTPKLGTSGGNYGLGT